MLPDEILAAMALHTAALDALTRELIELRAWTRPRAHVAELRERYAELWGAAGRLAHVLRPRRRRSRGVPVRDRRRRWY